MRRGVIDDQRGSVLLLGLGFMGVVLIALSVAVDASLAFVQRSVVQARADAAVLAGVQAIDIDSYYAQGATPGTALIPHDARSKTFQHLERANRSSQIDGLEIVAVTATSSSVEAVLRVPVRTAFWPIEASISVRAQARLDYVG